MENGAAEPRELVRELRIRMGSHDALADELGTTRQTVIRWEKGAAPNEHYRERLAALTGRAADAFVVHRENNDLVARLAKLEEALRELPALVAAELSRSDDATALTEREQRVADQLRAQSELLVQLAAAAAEMREAARDLQDAATPAKRRPA